MLKTLLASCIEGNRLTEQEAYEAMDVIMKGEATESQIASLLSILRYRGETVDEMTGFARAMKEHVIQINHMESFVVDTCGTGGDLSSTFNISTAAAIGLSAMGVKVAKHGNRSVSSKSGSADVLEKLNISVQSTPEEAARSLKDKQMAFLFAPLYHVSMKHAVAPRKEIGFRTIFNLLGPLTNPANADAQVIGVFKKEAGLQMAETLQRLGAKRAMLVTGSDGLDEITITGETYVAELKDGEIFEYTITPEEMGAVSAPIKEVQVETAEESAALIEKIFANQANCAAIDILLLNTAAALYVSDETASIKEGYQKAKAALEEGLFLKQLYRLQESGVKESHA